MKPVTTPAPTNLRFGRFTCLATIILIGAGLAAVPALAQSSSVFTDVQSKTTDIFTNIRNILMVVGAIGVLGLATMAFFGKFKWSWAVSLLGGLALISLVSQVIKYFLPNASLPS